MTRPVALLLALAAVACGDGGDTPDARIVLADASLDAHADDAGLADAGSDAGLDDRFAAVREDYARMDEVACRCRFAEIGFASEAACRAAIGWSDAAYACDHMGYEADPEHLHDYYVCVDEELAAQAACLEAAACDAEALAACPTRYSCPGPLPSATDAYYDVRDPCVRDTIVGAPGGCAEAEVATAVGSAVFHGSTMLAGDDTMGSCGGDGAPDHGHRFRAPSAGRYTFDTRGSSYDTVLYVLAACDGAELACDDEDETGPQPFAHTSRLEVTLAADQEVVVAVDGYDPESAGEYVINVSLAP